MKIVGIGGFWHDFNCAVVDLDKKIVTTAEEERFTRIKHHPLVNTESGNPLTETTMNCVDYCLKEAGLDYGDIDTVCFSRDKDFPLMDFFMKRFPNAKRHQVNHHVSHAAAAFYSSGYDEAAVLSLDGFGDDQSGVLAYGKGNKLEIDKVIHQDHSIGLEYLRATHHIGLGKFGSEGKTQGLAPYGKPTYLEEYMSHIHLKEDGVWELDKELMCMKDYMGDEHYMGTSYLYNDFLFNLFDRRISHDTKLEDNHINLASTIQRILEDLAEHSAKYLKKLTGSENLVTTGGVALNSSMNGHLLETGIFKNIYSHPSASDRGLGLGAALYHAFHEMETTDNFFKMENVYFGRQFNDDQIKTYLDGEGLEYEKLNNTCKVTAELVSEGKIVGWFQGRSEIGARALGNRTICADARKAEMKDIINERVKHREWFRPFAPSVIAEDTNDYFIHSIPLPFMTFTVKATPGTDKKIPAVIHEDNTARIQDVYKDQNAKYYKLLEEYRDITGISTFLNTSFNDAGDPIVDSPADAIECLKKSDMDLVVLKDYIVWKPNRS